MPDLFLKGQSLQNNEISLKSNSRQTTQIQEEPPAKAGATINNQRNGQAEDYESKTENSTSNNQKIAPIKSFYQPETGVLDPLKISKTMSPFTAFCSYPDNFNFKDQEDGEEIILIVKRHLITNFPWLFQAFLLVLLPIGLYFFIPLVFPFLTISLSVKNLYLAFYYLLVLGFVLIKFSIWYFNLSIITNKRMIGINVSGMLFKNIIKTKLDLLQDISCSRTGGIMSIFNYGDCLIRTTGETPNFELESVPNPEKIVQIISNLIGKK